MCRYVLALLIACSLGAGHAAAAEAYALSARGDTERVTIAKADKDCDDFSTQHEAQNFFLAHGGPQRDPHRLDGDGDGKACEELPCPCGASSGGGGGGGGQGGGSPPRDLTDHAKVREVVDGNTIRVRLHHKTRDVRLVGIDTPEVYGGRECGGPDASRAMKKLLDRGDRVKLIRDPSQDARDRYGRLLRYVEHSGTDVGRKQILRGWAHVYVYNHNPFRRVGSYRHAQREAKRHDRGAWGDCGGHFRTTAAPGHAAAKTKTQLVCLNGDGSEYRRKERPKQCAIYGPGGIFAGGVNLKKLKWKDWGHKRAKAKGIECGFHLPCADIKAKVKAWRPRERCGKRVYTRLRATTRFGHSRAGVHGCPGPAF